MRPSASGVGGLANSINFDEVCKGQTVLSPSDPLPEAPHLDHLKTALMGRWPMTNLLNMLKWSVGESCPRIWTCNLAKVGESSPSTLVETFVSHLAREAALIQEARTPDRADDIMHADCAALSPDEAARHVAPSLI